MPAEGEDRLLRWLRRRLGEGSLLGDDAAVLPAPGPLPATGPLPGPSVVTVDSQIEGVHLPAGLDPAILARRLLAVNLSDLAAMGARPTWALLALAAPRGFDHRRFFTALLETCRGHRVTLAGGDLARSPGGVVATLTLAGTSTVEGRLLRRSGARPGHELWVGGTLGESAAGCRLVERGARIEGRRVRLPQGFTTGRDLARAARRAVRRHLLPRPQLDLGQCLAELPEGAAIDLSDGLALDLRRLCAESGVGAVVDPDRLPVPALFANLCRSLGEDPIELALGGGEDYVLLFTLPADLSPPAAFRCHRIGSITAARRIRLAGPGGSRPLPRLGWDHLG